MALTEKERERIRTHLGYLSTSPSPAIHLGLLVPLQPLFLVERAMSNLIPEAEDTVRFYIMVLERIDRMLFEAQERLKVTEVGEVKIRETECEALRKEYKYWAMRLANVLGVPLNPISWVGKENNINILVN